MDIRCFLSIAAGSGAALMPHPGMAQAVQLEPVTGALALGAQSSSLFNLQQSTLPPCKRATHLSIYRHPWKHFDNLTVSSDAGCLVKFFTVM